MSMYSVWHLRWVWMGTTFQSGVREKSKKESWARFTCSSSSSVRYPTQQYGGLMMLAWLQLTIRKVIWVFWFRQTIIEELFLLIFWLRLQPRRSVFPCSLPFWWFDQKTSGCFCLLLCWVWYKYLILGEQTCLYDELSTVFVIYSCVPTSQRRWF